MKILFEVGHPAHVHLFKYTMKTLEKRGHEIKICVRERENIVKRLLDIYGFEYENLEPTASSLMNKAARLLKNDYKLLKIANKFNPDLFVSITTPYSAQVSRLKGKPFIAFADSEPIGLILSLTLPFTDVMISPIELRRDFGEKHIRIKGYKELAYLHPNWFKPNPDILNMLGVSEGDKYAILRLNAFDASHDIGIKGFTLEDKRKLVREIGKHAKVFISSETSLPEDLQEYAIKMPPHKMHDALYYASLLITDAQTSTTEAACLGTPAVRCNSFVGPNDMSNFVELEEKYHMIYNIGNHEKAIDKGIEIIQIQGIKEEWATKRKKLLSDKIDVTAFMSWFIEDYPYSYNIMKENPGYQERFGWA